MATAETAADSEEAAPSEPDPASTRSQSASRACSKAVGEINEGRAAGMRNGRGEADLSAQRRDHEGPRVEHEPSVKWVLMCARSARGGASAWGDSDSETEGADADALIIVDYTTSTATHRTRACPSVLQRSRCIFNGVPYSVLGHHFRIVCVAVLGGRRAGGSVGVAALGGKGRE